MNPFGGRLAPEASSIVDAPAGAAYARRYALFTLVGIAGEDDLTRRCPSPATCPKQGAGAQGVSDEFAVPLCRGHDREVRRCGRGAEWWRSGLRPPAARYITATHPPPWVQNGTAIWRDVALGHSATLRLDDQNLPAEGALFNDQLQLTANSFEHPRLALAEVRPGASFTSRRPDRRSS